MIYDVIFSPAANNDIKEHRKGGNKALLRKLSQLLKDIAAHPYTGAGRPEHLKYISSNCWSDE